MLADAEHDAESSGLNAEKSGRPQIANAPIRNQSDAQAVKYPPDSNCCSRSERGDRRSQMGGWAQTGCAYRAPLALSDTSPKASALIFHGMRQSTCGPWGKKTASTSARL